MIYAQRAAVGANRDGTIDKSLPRKLAALPTRSAARRRELVKTPLYEAKVDPDIYFFGFDLTAETARGGQIGGRRGGPGLVLRDQGAAGRAALRSRPRPGRAPSRSIATWNELAWTDVVDGTTPPGNSPDRREGVGVADRRPGADAQAQHDEDRAFQWRADTDAAELAYILYQVPVLVAVHAAEMLKQAGAP